LVRASFIIGTLNINPEILGNLNARYNKFYLILFSKLKDYFFSSLSFSSSYLSYLSIKQGHNLDRIEPIFINFILFYFFDIFKYPINLLKLRELLLLIVQIIHLIREYHF